MRAFGALRVILLCDAGQVMGSEYIYHRTVSLHGVQSSKSLRISDLHRPAKPRKGHGKRI